MIRLEAVTLRLGRAGPASEVVFSLPAFEAAAGEAIALTGPSGCGKSTLLNVVSGLRRADAGTVQVAGAELTRMGTAQLDRHRGAHCGMVHQTFHLLAPFSAVENVAIGLRFGARKRGDLRARAADVLRRVGLGERLNSRPAELSVGSASASPSRARSRARRPSSWRTNGPVPSIQPRGARSSRCCAGWRKRTDARS
ncbi:MAG: ATP-binding cassette domain-containing protein [Planctomycetota bacterium]